MQNDEIDTTTIGNMIRCAASLVHLDFLFLVLIYSSQSSGGLTKTDGSEGTNIVQIKTKSG
jgi:hypothetical protein